MIRIDIDAVKDIVRDSFVPKIQRAYGDEGVGCLKTILEVVRALYRHVEPETVNGSIVVFMSVSGGARPAGDWRQLTDVSYSVQECPIAADDSLNVEACANGRLNYCKSQLNAMELSKAAVVYFFKAGTEGFFVDGQFEVIRNPYTPDGSVFSVPTYSELKDAIEDYGRRMIKTSKCPIFGGVWHGGANGPRLFFKAKPEITIRRSLSHFLDIVMRQAEVAPEQNVDETHPVDIKVTWMFCNRLALIELKWMGASVNDQGRVTTTYQESRANHGAKQLTDYMDQNYRNTPLHNRRGYLVVVDGRRRGLTEGDISIGSQDGLWFRDRDITFSPPYHETRHDFEEPIRLFTEPVWKDQ